MPTLAEIRTQYPQYQDLSDRQLADGLYKKFYADMDRGEFDRKLGVVGASDSAPTTNEGFLEGFGSSFKASAREVLPNMGSGIEAQGIGTGIGVLERSGTALREATKSDVPAPNLVPLKQFFEKPFTFIGEQMGAGVASTLPSLVGGAAGSVLGPGGMLAGAGLPALQQNTGDLFDQLQQEGVDRERAGKVAFIWGPVLTVPDVFATSRLLKPFLGTATDMSTKGVARLLARRIAQGATVEGLTEFGQQVGQEGIAAIETGNPDLAARAERAATAGIAGALTGGVTGAGGAVVEHVRGPQAPPGGAPPAPPPQGTPPIGAAVGLSDGADTFRATVQGYSPDGAYVFLADEDGQTVTVPAKDLPGMVTEAPAAKTPAEPVDEVPPGGEEQAAFYAQNEPAPQEPDQAVLPLSQPEEKDFNFGGIDEAPVATDAAAPVAEARGVPPTPTPQGADPLSALPDAGETVAASTAGSEATSVAPQERRVFTQMRDRYDAMAPVVAKERPDLAPASPQFREEVLARVAEVDGSPDVKSAALQSETVEQSAPSVGADVTVSPTEGQAQQSASVIDENVLGDTSDLVKLRNAARVFARQFTGKSVQNSDTGRYIKIVMNAVKNALSHSPTSDSVVATTAIPDLLRRAKFIGRRRNRRPEQEPDIPYVHLYGARVNIGGREYPVHVVVKETVSGDLLYDQILLDNPEAAGISGAVAPDQGVGADRPATASGIQISAGISGSPSDAGSYREGRPAAGLGEENIGPTEDDGKPTRQPMRRPTKPPTEEQNARILAAGAERIGAATESVTKQELLSSVAKPPPPPTAPTGQRGADGGKSGPVREMYRLGKMWAYSIQASAVASRDRAFARVYNLVMGQHHTETALIKDGGEKLDSMMSLNDKQANVFNQIAEYIRISGKVPRRVGKSLTLRVDPITVTEDSADGAPVKRTKMLALSKTGDVLVADEATTKAIFDALSYGKERWMMVNGSMALEMGYEGAFTRPAIEAAIKNGKGTEKATAEVAMVIFEAADERARKGYFPLMRYGDTAIVVRPKPGAASNKMGGKPSVKDGGVFFVESEGAISGLFSGQSKIRPRVQKRMDELRKQFPPDQYDIEHKYLRTAKDVSELDLSAAERLMTVANLRDAKQAAAAYKDALGIDTAEYEKALAELSRALPGAVRKRILDKMKAGILRESEDILGYDTDFRRGMLDYNRITSGMISRRLYRRKLDAAKTKVFGDDSDPNNKIKAESHPSVQKFAQRWMDYLDAPEHAAWRNGRWLGFYMNIFGSLGSAAVNGISTATVTMPQIASWSPGGAAGVPVALGRVSAAIRWDNKMGFTISQKAVMGLTPEERAAVARAQPQLAPSIGLEFSGTDVGSYPAARQTQSVLRRYSNIGSSLFNVVEQINRYTAFLASYRAAQNPAARARFNRQYAKDERVQDLIRTEGLTPEMIARYMVDQTQFIGGQYDRPSVMRGAGGVAFQFKTYPLNYVRVLSQNLMRQGPQGKFAAGLMLMSLFAFSGILGLPFAQDALDLAEIANKAMTGEEENFEAGIRGFIADMTGGGEKKQVPGAPEESDEAYTARRNKALLGAEIATRGGSRQWLGADLGTRVGMGNVTPSMGDVVQAVPLLAATVGKVQEAIRRERSGQPAGAAIAAVSPFIGKGPADALRGLVQYPEEGYRTQRGKGTYIDPTDITYGEMALKAFGFQPARMATRLEKDHAEDVAAHGDDELKSNHLTELGGLRSMAEKAQKGDPARAKRLEDALDRRRTEIDAKAAEGRGPKAPEMKAIKQRAQLNLEPERKIKTVPKDRRERVMNVPFVDR